MKKITDRLPWLMGLLVVAVFLAYGFWPEVIKVDAVSVTRGSLLVTIDDEGETRIREKYVISAPVTGKLLRLRLHSGDQVTQSKTELARILPADPGLLDARSQAECEARVRAAEAARDQAEANLMSSRETEELAEDHYRRAMKLASSQSISAAEFDEAEHRQRMARANVRSAELEAKVRSFELELAQAARMRAVDQSAPEPYAAVSITSPIDGRVLRVLQEDAGLVSAGAALLEIGDPQDLEMKIEVLSTDAVRILPGAKVFVTHWGEEHRLTGVVRIVEPTAFLKISALGVEEKRVNVIADFVEPFETRKTLGDGYRIGAQVVVHVTAADSLKIAAGALFRQDNTWHVYRIQAGKAELVSVEVGATNGLETEIFHGLKEGDLVVSYPTEKIHPGVAVNVSRDVD